MTEVGLCWSHRYGDWKWVCVYCRCMWNPVEQWLTNTKLLRHVCPFVILPTMHCVWIALGFCIGLPGL